ncbi:ice-binding family protein [uncultured Winogradskyella sp.]|uniref:ice-binding family protein n=1 Tax=uncultured Winogradskyella sp. TaxID=395353 RepID=UPI0030D70EB3
MIIKTKFLCPILLIVLFFFGTYSAISQINLRSIENFSLFTSAGAVGNTVSATSIITGDIGTNTGTVNGFESPTVVNGNIEIQNAITVQAALDLTAVVDQINNIETTSTHIPVFGNGETLTPGVYSQAAAASLNETLTLDAQGDSNAQFIFKIGGAFSTAAGATVVLINCASPANIFWLSGGAISMAASTTISGNLISNPGAVDIGSGGNITGRMLSTTGAIAVYGTEATNPETQIISAITQPTCTTTTGSFQIRDYDPTIANQYTFTPSVISTSTTGLVIANPNTYILSYPNSGDCIASVVINTASLTNYWTGAISSDWNNIGNWTCAVPSDLNNYINIIPVATTTYPIIGAEPDNSGIAENLEILSGASLTINDNSLRLTAVLKLNGKLNLQGESQLLQDTGSVLDAASTGSIEINQQGTGNSFRYNYWSSPVNSGGTNFTIGEVLRDGTDPNNIIDIDFGSSYTYADGTTSSPIKLSTAWMYKLEDSGLGYSAWESAGNNGEVNVGQGYTMKGTNANAEEQNYTFVGEPNNGIIELTVGANNNHLVGNPYPSAIDADKFIDDNGIFSGTASITGTIYFWEHYGGDTHNLADYQAGYGTYTKSGGVSASSNPSVSGVSTLGFSVKGAPERHIPVGQAFFLVGDADGGQIQFNNSQRVFAKESPGNSVFMRTNASEARTNNDLRPKFRIGFDAPQISHRQILLTLDENTTDAVDWGYDAEMYDVYDDDMYWVLDDKKYVIQATNEFDFDKEIPIGIQTLEGGLVSIEVDELENAEDYTPIYIKDNLTGQTHDITNQNFSINLEAGEYLNRFFIVRQPTLNVLEEETLLDGIQIYMNNSISELQLNLIVNTEILNVSLFNYLGQRAKTWNINTDERSISLPLQLASGVYIAVVETKSGKVNKKIIIY